MKVLVVTAVEAERVAVLDGGGGVEVITVGVGLAMAAANTAFALARGGYDAVVSTGIAGGFDGRAAIGETVIATRTIAGDLGAESPVGFITIDDLGFGTSALDTDPSLRQLLAAQLANVRTGAILSVNTVTGTAETAAALVVTHADAVAEAMEGYGAACAAAAMGIPFAEVRTISNLVGPRDRATWRIGDALTALRDVGAALATLEA
jgi:futalosine hydrolase